MTHEQNRRFGMTWLESLSPAGKRALAVAIVMFWLLLWVSAIVLELAVHH